MGPNDLGYADGFHEITARVDELEFRCGPAGHDYAISGPFNGSDVARRYDLICSKCGDAKMVKVQAG